jgi:CheY-like chemotaxis protein
MMGCAEMLMNGLPENDPRHADAVEIHRAAERGAALTHQLLAFSRRQVLEARALDLDTIVTGMEPMLRRLIGDDVEISTSLDPSSGKVLADPGQIEQVIMNLVVNARDAMPTGGLITIETAPATFDEAYVRQHPPARVGDYVMLAISDNGVGMDEHIRGHIFDPFFTTKEVGKGTGLGLATVYGIVKQTDGFIWVYSEPGKGSVFKIYLPRTEAGVEISRPPGEPMSLEGTETVLLVEDDESIRRLMRESLRRLGYAVHEAADGASALEVADALGEIDLLVTDVVMPRMSGRELATRLLSRHPTLAVLYMSGYTDDTVIRHGVLEAGSLYLQKPFNLEALARKVRVVLGARPRPARR